MLHSLELLRKLKQLQSSSKIFGFSVEKDGTIIVMASMDFRPDMFGLTKYKRLKVINIRHAPSIMVTN